MRTGEKFRKKGRVINRYFFLDCKIGSDSSIREESGPELGDYNDDTERGNYSQCILPGFVAMFAARFNVRRMGDSSTDLKKTVVNPRSVDDNGPTIAYFGKYVHVSPSNVSAFASAWRAFFSQI